MSAGTAYGGAEMLGLTAAECRFPRRVMGIASKLVAGRITLLYLLPVLMLGLVLKVEPVPADDDTATKELVSPFVLAVSQASIPVLPDLMNAIIVVSVFFHGQCGHIIVFAASRALQAISARGMGPRFCARLYRDKPIGALAVVFSLSLLSFAKAAKYGDVIFVWLLALASCSNYLTWSSICVAQIRYRLALKQQGRTLTDPEAYRSPEASWVLSSLSSSSCSDWRHRLWPLLRARCSHPPSPPACSSFIGLLVVIAFWIGYMLFKRDRTLVVPLNMIELGPKEHIFSATDVINIEHAFV
ncbi:amino acid permease/ SLC12A domain-containing protein [Xylaria digitata]|nr:amino acid permease/ SLC12A domain-containing protein [Xylaria digitata]